jgi:hypothetical protein
MPRGGGLKIGRSTIDWPSTHEVIWRVLVFVVALIAKAVPSERVGKSGRLAALEHQAANQSFAGTSSRKVSISEIRPSRTRTTSTPLIGS